ncbi:MAG TPA: glycosyltransferase [Nitrospirota bacterium]|nr:glycosyltransferase [Nitrospirota bacterium]
MIRIAHIITGLNTGGAESMLYKLLSRADRTRFEPVVISLSGYGTLGKQIEGLPVRVFDIGMNHGRQSFIGICRLISLVRKLKPNIVQGWMYHGNLTAQLATIFIPNRTPVVWNVRQSLYSLAYEKNTTAAVIKLCGYLSQFPAAIVYNSMTSASHHEAIGYRVESCAVIPNGFDTDLFVPSEQARSSVRAELGLPGDTHLIGLIGRYHPVKDHQCFLEAAALLKGGIDDVHFILAGSGVDDQNRELRNEITNKNITERMHLLGERQDIPRLTAALDIATSSSRSEGFSNVIGEAMSCGVPCVVTDVGDSASIVGDTGTAVPQRDPRALSDAWTGLIRVGKEKRRALGQKARQRICEHYSLDTVVRDYEALYERLSTGAKA